jgi:hypothetical protein
MADYHAIIARAVSRSPDATDEAKQAIYDQARTEQQVLFHFVDSHFKLVMLIH